MTGYVRQSAADIVPTGVVRAAPINNELNALRDAFATAGGHKHDGTAAEGHPVPVIGDSDLLNKIATDTGNNRHGVFVEVGGVAVEQVRFQDGAIVPVTDNDIDLGTSSNEFKNLFITGTANIDSLVADTADINGGTVDGAVIGGSSAAAGSFTTIGATGAITSTVSTGTAPLVIASTTKVSNLNVDQLDGADWAAPAAIGTSTPAAGTFTSLTANTSLVAATADINGGTLDGAVIGASSAQAITGTTVTATTGFVGGLTGNVTGNTTGTHTGAVIGNVTGDVTGNVTASSGSSSFNDVVINGGLNMNAGTSATITNLTSPTNTNDAATKGYVDTSIANLIDSAPGALDTLNELAAALGDDASFSTTVTNSIATKLALAGGTMSGAIAMGTNKITGLGNPTANQDAATKTYVDTADALKLSLTGGTMSGAIAMGTSKITGLGDPTANQDAATKIYVDGILGSATSAAASAAAAAVSASNAATSASNASTSASNAATSASSASTSATNAAASYDAFDDRYLGSKTSAPSVDNDGNALLTGALYWNSTSSELYLWTGSAWTRSALSGTDYVAKSGDTMTGALTTTALTLSGGTANGVAYLNGSKVLTSGSALTFDGTNFATTGAGTFSGLLSRIHAQGTDAYITNTTTGKANTVMGFNDSGSTTAQGIPTGYSYYGTLQSYPIGFTSGGYLTNSISSTAHIWNTTGTEQMRLTSTGLGIGTTTMGRKLNIAAPTAAGIQFQPTGTGGRNYSIFATDSGASVSGALAFYDDTAGAYRVVLDSAGNLGLGRTPVAYSTFRVIDVAGSAGAIQKWVHTGSTVELQAYASSGLTGIGSATNHPLILVSNDTERARIDASGNLLVGGTAARGTTVGTKHLDLFDGTAPAGTLTNGVSVYSSSGDLKFMDAAGNAYDVGFRNIPQNAQTGNYTMVLSDAGKHIYHAVGAGAATYTIPANGSVAYAIGTAITFVNLSSTSISIAITTDTMYLSSAGTTGTRTLAQYGSATAIKVTSTVWLISGSGLT